MIYTVESKILATNVLLDFPHLQRAKLYISLMFHRKKGEIMINIKIEFFQFAF